MPVPYPPGTTEVDGLYKCAELVEEGDNGDGSQVTTGTVLSVISGLLMTLRTVPVVTPVVTLIILSK